LRSSTADCGLENSLAGLALGSRLLAYRRSELYFSCSVEMRPSLAAILDRR
jgi:hypothetical protein